MPDALPELVPNAMAPSVPRELRKKDKVVGSLLCLSPLLMVLLGLVMYFGLKFVIHSTDISARLFGVAIGFMTMAGVYFCLFLLLPIGIVSLLRKRLPSDAPADERSGKGSASIFPREVAGWSLGAAGLPILWSVFHSVWWIILAEVVVIVLNMAIGFFAFITVQRWINIFAFLMLIGFKSWSAYYGKRWAWQKQGWESVAYFKAAQRGWDIAGAIFLVLSLLGMMLNFIFILAFPNQTAVLNGLQKLRAGNQPVSGTQTSQVSAPQTASCPTYFLNGKTSMPDVPSTVEAWHTSNDAIYGQISTAMQQTNHLNRAPMSMLFIESKLENILYGNRPYFETSSPCGIAISDADGVWFMTGAADPVTYKANFGNRRLLWVPAKAEYRVEEMQFVDDKTLRIFDRAKHVPFADIDLVTGGITVLE